MGMCSCRALFCCCLFKLWQAKSKQFGKIVKYLSQVSLSWCYLGVSRVDVCRMKRTSTQGRVRVCVCATRQRPWRLHILYHWGLKPPFSRAPERKTFSLSLCLAPLGSRRPWIDTKREGDYRERAKLLTRPFLSIFSTNLRLKVNWKT